MNKSDFPIFAHQPRLVYLDSAATSLKPQTVIDSTLGYYTRHTANIHRGLYKNAVLTDKLYEASREKVAQFIGAASDEIIFTRNATESSNLVAYTWGLNSLGPKDEIVTTVMEHHAIFVTWQQIATKTGAKITYVDITDDGRLDINKFKSALTPRTKFVAFTHVSNVLGTINPVGELVALVKKYAPQALVLIDGAQAIPHLPVNISSLGCDFYVFSGHKMLSPTGIGVLWGKRQILKSLPPFMFGGDMIKKVTLTESLFADPPTRFEAGTPHIAGVIGLAAAIDYISYIGIDKIKAHEDRLTAYALTQLSQIPDLTLYGPTNPKAKTGVISFNLTGIHPHDLSQSLSEANIAVRAGHHCAMPLHTRLGVPATVRASLYLYNDESDIDKLIKGLKIARKLFSHG